MDEGGKAISDDPNRASRSSVVVETRPGILPTVLLAVLLVPVIPLVIILVLVPSFILRLLAILSAKLFRPDLDQILLRKEAAFALETINDRPKFNILLHFHFQDEVPVTVTQRAFQELLDLRDEKGNFQYRKLRQTYAHFMGFLFWKWDKQFDLKNHVRVYDYKEPELAVPSPCAVQELQRVSGALLEMPWPAGRSPWELLLFRCYSTYEEEEEDSSADSEKVFTVAALRIHHGMADGFSILGMLLKIVEENKVQIPVPRLPQLSMLQRVALRLAVVLRMPVDVARSLLSSFDRPHCWHCEDTRPERNYYVFYSGKIPVDTIKKIKNKYGVSYNEAIYAVATGVVRRMMLAAGQEVPKAVSGCVPLPLPNHPGGLCNHMTLLFFRFTPSIAEPVERMSKISEAFQYFRAAPTVPVVNSWVFDSLSSVPTWALSPVQYKILRTSVLMTNFPGPESVVTLKGGGSRITGITAVMGKPAGSWGATSLMLSYAGVQRISFTLEKKLFEGHKVPENFPKLVDDEIKALLAE